MRVHHLNCGTLRPLGRRFVNGEGSPLLPGRMVCHCLLVETDRRLVLVDTGFGLDDIAELRRSPLAHATKADRRRQVQMRLLTRARLDPAETAVRQLPGLGFAPADVSDVVLTHLDADHAGGLRDFPRARVHVTATELQAALRPSTPLERFRYWQRQWSHGPDWVTYESHGDAWFGFAGVRELDGLPDLAFVPLPGHTRGLAGVALRTAGADHWLLHAGDAYFFHGEAEPGGPPTPPATAAFERRFQADGRARHKNQERLRALNADHGHAVDVVCSHDPVELDRTR